MPDLIKHRKSGPTFIGDTGLIQNPVRILLILYIQTVIVIALHDR
jgi:hypothetical protein